MSLKYNGKRIPLAKKLRKEATPQERRLWYGFLAKYPVRFQRQKVIGDYIADFYCHRAKLVIEIDGSQHYETEEMEKDQNRTRILEEFGLKVIRFSNREINLELQAVCTAIDETVRTALFENNDKAEF